MAVTAETTGPLALDMWQTMRDSNPLRCMLIDDSWSFSKDTAHYVAEVTGEVSGTGYTAGGQSLLNVSEEYNATDDAFVVNADDPVWDATGGALSADRAVFYVDTGNDSTSRIVAVWDFGETITATNAPFRVQLDDSGLLRLTV